MTRASRRTSVRIRALTKSPGHSVSSKFSKIALSRMVALRACRVCLSNLSKSFRSTESVRYGLVRWPVQVPEHKPAVDRPRNVPEP